MSLPQVGAKKLHLTTLTPQVRKILHKRATKAAQRAEQPMYALARREKGLANRAYGAEASSIRGATQESAGVLNQALHAAKHSGLQGPYLRELLHGITAKEGQAALAVPYLLADPAKERREAITTAQTNLLTDHATAQKSGAEAFNQLLKEARTSGSSQLKEEEQHKKPSKEEVTKLKAAAIAFQDALGKWEANPVSEITNAEGNKEKVHFQTALPLRTPAEWRTFAVEMEKHYAGFDLPEALHVVRQYVKKVVAPKWRKLNQTGQYTPPPHTVLHPGTE